MDPRQGGRTRGRAGAGAILVIEKSDLITMLAETEHRIAQNLASGLDRITTAVNTALLEQERRNSTFATRDALDALRTELHATQSAGIQRAFGIVAAILSVVAGVVITFLILQGR